MGTVEVPAHVYWGAQTARSLIHFNIGHDLMPPELIWAFGILTGEEFDAIVRPEAMTHP
jgi:fumarate hydratase class II